jgi:glycine/D-amino acid oxidase-like deaminating enzyme
MTEKKRVVICGAGIAGISAAHYLSRLGIGDILLVDERPPLTLTSDRSTECYRNWWPDAAMLALMNRSIELMEQLADASANVFRMNRRGYVYFTGDPEIAARMQESAAVISAAGGGPLRLHEASLSHYQPADPDGYATAPGGADLLLGEAAVRRAFPYVTNAAVAALHVRRAGWLSAQQLGMHMLEGVRAQGVQFRKARLTSVEKQAGRISGITLDDAERIDCEVFINAAGPYFKTVGALIDTDLPVEAEVHLKVAFEDSLHHIPRHAPLLIWNDPQNLPWGDDERQLFAADRAYAHLTQTFPAGAHTRPEGGEDGATVLMLWDYRRHVIDPVFPVPLDDQYPEIVLRGLAAMVPGLNAYIGRAARPRLDGGYYVRTAENRPLIGPTPVKGAYLLGAISGFGIMSACAVGELLAAHVVGDQLPGYAAAFALSRYEDPAYRSDLGGLSETGEL